MAMSNPYKEIVQKLVEILPYFLDGDNSYNFGIKCCFFCGEPRYAIHAKTCLLC
jgi:hypothetical protein